MQNSGKRERNTNKVHFQLDLLSQTMKFQLSRPIHNKRDLSPLTMLPRCKDVTSIKRPFLGQLCYVYIKVLRWHKVTVKLTAVRASSLRKGIAVLCPQLLPNVSLRSVILHSRTARVGIYVSSPLTRRRGLAQCHPRSHSSRRRLCKNTLAQSHFTPSPYHVAFRCSVSQCS